MEKHLDIADIASGSISGRAGNKPSLEVKHALDAGVLGKIQGAVKK